MTLHRSCGCSEYERLSRRRFLALSGGSALLAASAPAWLPRVALARDHRGAQRDVLVAIFLRGGVDALSLCVPYTDANYYAARPSTAIAPPGSGAGAALDLGAGGQGLFGLAPSMAPLMPAYTDGKLLIVHACGQPSATRSHFDEQRSAEGGIPSDPRAGTGWLGRHIASVAPMNPDSPLRAVALNWALQDMLAGAPAAIPLPYITGFGLTGATDSTSRRMDAINQLHAAGQSEVLRASSQATIQTIQLLQNLHFESYQPAGGAAYPQTAFGTALKSAAALIKGQVGVEAIAVDLGGWDTHDAQGAATGRLASLLGELASALGAFYRDMTAQAAPGFVVACMSEFGRNLGENASGGTDHGSGGAMLLMGGCVAGGRVLTDWPGLEPEQLFEYRDLRVTIDYRDILGEVVTSRLGNEDLQAVFPGYSAYTARGVVSC